MTFTEQEVEQIAVDWFRDLGYDYASGLDIAPDGAAPERKTYADVHLEGRFRSALARINPHLPSEALDDVTRRVLRPASPTIEENNHAFRRVLTRGVGLQVRQPGRAGVPRVGHGGVAVAPRSADGGPREPRPGKEFSASEVPWASRAAAEPTQITYGGLPV